MHGGALGGKGQATSTSIWENTASVILQLVYTLYQSASNQLYVWYLSATFFFFYSPQHREAKEAEAAKIAAEQATEEAETDSRAPSAQSTSGPEGMGSDGEKETLERKEAPNAADTKLSTIGESNEHQQTTPESPVTSPVPAAGDVTQGAQLSGVTTSVVMSSLPDPGSDEWEYIANPIDEVRSDTVGINVCVWMVCDCTSMSDKG